MNAPAISRTLRKKSTDAEKKLWRTLRDRRFAGYKFRRQHHLGPHILDFYCAEARYDVEMDGGQHGFPDQIARDAERDAYLKSRNIFTRRFWNHQLRDTGWVREIIWAELQSRAPHLGNVQPAKRIKLPKRPRSGAAPKTSHPSPQPSPR